MEFLIPIAMIVAGAVWVYWWWQNQSDSRVEVSHSQGQSKPPAPELTTLDAGAGSVTGARAGGAALAFGGALVAGMAAFMPWVATSDGLTLDGFNYEGVYISGGVGSGLLLTSICAGLLALALLGPAGVVRTLFGTTTFPKKPLSLLCAGCGAVILLLVVAAAATINEGIREWGIYSSTSGGSTQAGIWIAALGGVGVIVGSLLAGFVTEPVRVSQPSADPTAMKACPMCAEQVRAQARICRFCRYEFTPAGPTAAQAATAPWQAAPSAAPPPSRPVPHAPSPVEGHGRDQPPGEGPVRWGPPPTSRPPDRPVQ